MNNVFELKKQFNTGWFFIIFNNNKLLLKNIINKKKCNDPSAGSPTDTLLRLLLPLITVI